MLGREPRGWAGIDGRAMRRHARELLRGLNLDIDPGSLLGSHSLAVQQLVSIARAIDVQAKVLVLDEPTSSLDADEVEELFRVIRSLKESGVAILFVSHFLDQVYEISDRLTVLRNGRLVGEYRTDELLRIELVHKMIGKEMAVLDQIERRTQTADADEELTPYVQAVGLGRKGSIEPIDLTIYEGEVVGLAGLLGSGRTELARILSGVDRSDTGTLTVHGRARRFRSPRAALKQRIAYSSENRRAEGIVGDLTIRDNIVLALQSDRGWLRRIPRRRQDELAASYIEALNIRPANPDALVRNLSGGNQQKVLLARWLATAPRLLILDEPTRGIDVGAKAEIQKLVADLADNGMSVLFISAELEEVLRLEPPGRGAARPPQGGRPRQRRPHRLRPPGRHRRRQRPRGGDGMIKIITHRLFWPVVLLLVLFVVNLVAFPGFFPIEIKDGHLFGSLIDILRNGAPTLIVAIGMTLVIATRGIDLSVGAVGAIAGALACSIILDSPDPGSVTTVVTAVVVSLLVAVVLGLWNGALVSVIGIQPIVATLILMTAGRGVAMLITEGQILTVNSPPFKVIGSGFLLGVPVAVVVAAVIFLAAALLTRQTALGMLIESIGVNPEASRQAGVRARELLFAVYVFCAAVRRHRRTDPDRQPDGGGRQQHRPVHRAGRDPGRRHRRHLADRRSLLAARHPGRCPRHPDPGDDGLHGRHPADHHDGVQGRGRGGGLPAAVAGDRARRSDDGGCGTSRAPTGRRWPDGCHPLAARAGSRSRDVLDVVRRPLISPKYGPVLITALLLVAMFVIGGIRYTGFASPQVVLNLLVDNAYLIVLAVGHDLRHPHRRHRPVGRRGRRAVDHDRGGDAGRRLAAGGGHPVDLGDHRRSSGCWSG